MVLVKARYPRQNFRTLALSFAAPERANSAGLSKTNPNRSLAVLKERTRGFYPAVPDSW